MDIDDFYKVNAYACLLKVQGAHLDEYPASEITITLVRRQYPEAMFRALKGEGFSVCERQQGIYEVLGALFFRTQIVVTGQLEGDSHV